jgi:hypothetical protein
MLGSMVNNEEETLELIRESCSEYNDDVKLFAFAFGADSDSKFIKAAAKAGQGDSYIVKDYQSKQLKIEVVQALFRASNPGLQGFQFRFGAKDKDIDDNDVAEFLKQGSEDALTLINPDHEFIHRNILRNNLIRCNTIMSLDQFNAIQCTI